MATLNTDDGATLYYEVTGNAPDNTQGNPPLLFVHGWCSCMQHWQAQVDAFSADHQIITLDRRGHGKSTSPGSGHTAEQNGRDLAAVVEAAGLGPVVAVCHAGGGVGTLEFMRQRPELTRAGIVIDAGLYPDPGPDTPFGSIVNNMLTALRGPEAEQAFQTMYRGYFHPAGDSAQIEQIVAQATQVSAEVREAELESLLVDAAAIADEIKVPMLWITAADVDNAFIRQHIEQVQFGQVVGAAHFPQTEQPEQTNAMIKTFLTRL